MTKKIKYITQKNDNTFRIIFRISQNPDGSSNYYNKQISGITLEEAIQICNDAREKYCTTSIKRTINFNKTMNDIAKEWLEYYIRVHQSPTSYTEKVSKYKNYIAPFIGKKKINEIDKATVISYVNKLYSINGVKKGSHLSNNTIKHIINVSSGLYEYCKDVGYTNNTNPFREIKLKPIEKKDVKSYTASEINTIIDLLQNETLTTRAIIMMALFTGCRRGEIAGIKRQSIINKDGESFIQIMKSVTQTKEFGLVEKGTKNNQIRYVPLPNILTNVIDEYMKELENENIIDDYLFVTKEKDGKIKRITPNSIEGRWRRFITKNSDVLPVYKFHSLRASFASFLFEEGIKLQNVQSLLGHSSGTTTMKFYLAGDHDNINNVNNIINKQF